jgi:RNA polymerase sigma-70 factor (ECF subfamily)
MSTPPQAHDDRDVLALHRAGDTAGALQRLIERYGDHVRAFCRGVLRDPELGDDVCQVVFLEALRGLPRFAGQSTLRTWLFSIAHHRVIDAARRARRCQESQVSECEIGELTGLPDPQPSVEESFDLMQLRVALYSSLDSLDSQLRTAILMRYAGGLSYQEIADQFGENPGAIQVRVARALPRLRDKIKSQLAGKRRPRPTTDQLSH